MLNAEGSVSGMGGMSSTLVAAVPNAGLGSSSWGCFCSGLGRWARQDFPGWAVQLDWGARTARRALPAEGQGEGQSQRRPWSAARSHTGYWQLHVKCDGFLTDPIIKPALSRIAALRFSA